MTPYQRHLVTQKEHTQKTRETKHKRLERKEGIIKVQVGEDTENETKTSETTQTTGTRRRVPKLTPARKRQIQAEKDKKRRENLLELNDLVRRTVRKELTQHGGRREQLNKTERQIDRGKQ